METTTYLLLYYRAPWILTQQSQLVTDLKSTVLGGNNQRFWYEPMKK